MTPERIRFKGEAFRTGWWRAFGRQAILNELVIGISVAIAETIAGDAWPGEDGILGTEDDERNWGATMLRKLNAIERDIVAAAGRELLRAAGVDRDLEIEAGDRLDFTDLPQHFRWILDGKEIAITGAERAALAPLIPIVSKGHQKVARRAQKELRTALAECPARTPPDGRRGAIHCDSHPDYGPYFTWFAAFNEDNDIDGPEDNEADAATYFIRIVARTPEERAGLATGDPVRMATAMYAARYFSGFHKRDKDYPDPRNPGSTVKGSVLNIRAYAQGIQAHLPAVRAALTA